MADVNDRLTSFHGLPLLSTAACKTGGSKNRRKRRKKNICSTNVLMTATRDTVMDDKNSGRSSTQCPLFESLKNPLFDEQQAFLKKIPLNYRVNFFSDEHVSSSERARIWEDQADLGEEMINRYAWATPDSRALKIVKHFSPIVEIGSGSNAYWGLLMKQVGIDVVCYEKFPDSGGTFNYSSPRKPKKKRRKSTYRNKIVNQGGPEALAYPQNKDRTLFLCYPDEEEQSTPQVRKNVIGTSSSSCSMAKLCLNFYKGEFIIHVGELYGDSISLDGRQAPWGRSSSWDFQIELMKSFHCVLKCSLKSSWLHVRDTISVWKRTSLICTIAFAVGDDGECSEEHDGDVEEVDYMHIPSDERLPLDVAAPCMQHLLLDRSDE